MKSWDLLGDLFDKTALITDYAYLQFAFQKLFSRHSKTFIWGNKMNNPPLIPFPKLCKCFFFQFRSYINDYLWKNMLSIT